jgi:ribonucleotide reductase alpha subunit
LAILISCLLIYFDVAGVKANEDWSLFCPNEAEGLCDTYGKEFEELYEKYERQGKARRVIPAQKLWFSILDAQIETGMPYILYKGKLLQLPHIGELPSIFIDPFFRCL